MAFNQAWLTTTKFGSYGLTEGCECITIEGVEIPSGYATSTANPKAPLYRIVYREQFGVHFEPVNQPSGMLGPMANGVYAQVSNSQFLKKHITKILGYPCPDLIRVHDRFETQEQYDFLSR